MNDIVVRDLVASDILRLSEIDTSFTSEAILQVERAEEGLGMAWRLREMPLERPFERKNGYDFTARDLADLGELLAKGDGLILVAEAVGKLIALLEVRPQAWNHTAMVWNILIDRAYRRRGLGRHLMERAIAWSRGQDYRALMLETQSNNIDACRFYQHMGFRLSGIREDFYTNEDIARGEVAVFWSYVL